MAPELMGTGPAPAHRAQFYDDAAFLARRVGEFLAQALHAGGAVISVARPAHATAIARELERQGIDLATARRDQRLIELDAETLLARLLVDELPDRAQFRTLLGGQIASARAAGPGPIHVFGEMVDLLWSAERTDAVMQLEDLWNELAHEQPFSILCGYQLGTFAAQRHVHTFHELCGRHGQVASSEQLAVVCDDPATNRIISELEQRARALETEVAHRGMTELRLEQLLAVTGELAAASSHEDIARIAINQGTVAVGAAYGGLWMVDPSGASLTMLGVSGLPRGRADAWSRLPIELDAPVPQAARTGEPVFLESLADYRARFPASLARIADTISAPDLAYGVLPLIADGAVLGVMSLTFDGAREVEAGERAFLAILARQCALAFQRIRLYEIERESRQNAEAARTKSELLYQLTASCNQIEDLAAVYALALQTVERGAHCDRAAILLFDPDGVMRFKSFDGLSETYRQAVEGHSPWKRDMLDPMPIAIDDVELDPAWAAHLETFRAEGIRGLAFIPLVHQRQLLGKFMLYRNTPRTFTARQLQFSQLVAVQVAQAVDRTTRAEELARSLREVRAAHQEAEEATRAREEILSVVSHDLRNPLGTILMGASTLLQVADPADKKAQRVHTVAQRIHRQAERMARLIEDLVDFAGIQAGRLAIERAPHAPSTIIAQASDIFGPLAEERGLVFEASPAAGLPVIECDSERVLQIIANLVTNALKVTPRGGSIQIGASPREDEIVFFVRDSGPGIEPEDLPLLFERYWRSKQASYKGAGLGLSIARGLVDAHGGRIWAESQVGTGSTFYFSLQSTRSN